MLVLTAVIVGYFLVTGATTALRASRLSEREGRLEVEIAGFQQRYERLQALREYLSSDEYTEVVAREQFGLVKEGETGIVVISVPPSPTPGPEEFEEEEEAEDLWWQALIR